MSDSAFFKQEMTALRVYLDTVREILKSGFMPDVTGLDKRVTELCQQLLHADKESQREGLPELASLLQGLDDIEREMRAWHEAKMKGKTDD